MLRATLSSPRHVIVSTVEALNTDFYGIFGSYNNDRLYAQIWKPRKRYKVANEVHDSKIEIYFSAI